MWSVTNVTGRYNIIHYYLQYTIYLFGINIDIVRVTKRDITILSRDTWHVSTHDTLSVEAEAAGAVLHRHQRVREGEPVRHVGRQQTHAVTLQKYLD